MKKAILLSVFALSAAQAHARTWYYQCQFASPHMWARAAYAWSFVDVNQIDFNEDELVGTCTRYVPVGSSYCYDTKSDDGKHVSCNADTLGKFVATP